MRTRFRLLALTFFVATTSCGDHDPLTAPADESLRPELEIVDAVRGAGNPHFFFLPPIVAPPSTDGDFDDSVLPLLSVQICEWADGACLLPPLVEFAEPDIKLDLEGEAYFVNWRTSDFDVGEGKVYRIRVLISGADLGHADVQVVAGSELKNVDTEEFVPLTEKRSLQIRFRVEHGVGIVIDARALTVGTVRLQGTGGTFSTETIQKFVLAPGPYGLSYGAGLGAGTVEFSVSSDGTVDFDPSLDGILAGRGTTTLVVNGASIIIDATALTVATLYLRGVVGFEVGGFPTSSPLAVTLLPGRHDMVYPAGLGAGIVEFSVTSDGIVDFDPSLDGILAGRSTTTLVVNGASITIDATALTVATLYLRGVVGFEVGGFPTSSPLAVTLLPGRHDMAYPAGLGGGGIVEFSVSSDGTVDFDPSLDGILTGRGAATLLVRGAKITVNATASGSTTFQLSGVGEFPSSTVQLVWLLPGVHNYYTSTLAFKFTVLAEGLIDFDTALDPQVTGRGTSTLSVSS